MISEDTLSTQIPLRITNKQNWQQFISLGKKVDIQVQFQSPANQKSAKIK